MHKPLEDNLHSDGQQVEPESLIQPKSSARKKFMAKKHSNPGSNLHQNFQPRHSPLAFQVKKTLSKKNLMTNVTPTGLSQKFMLEKSPSLDEHAHSRSKNRLRSSKDAPIAMSHRANLSMSIARKSNRGIVTIASRKELPTDRVKSGRRRSSALSQRSTTSLDAIPQTNQAANKLYDKTVGK